MLRSFNLLFLFLSLISLMFCSKYTRKGEFTATSKPNTVAIPVSETNQVIAVDIPNLAGASVNVPSGALPANSQMTFASAAVPTELSTAVEGLDFAGADVVKVEITDKEGNPILASKPITLTVPKGKYPEGTLILETKDGSDEIKVSEVFDIPDTEPTNETDEADDNTVLQNIGLQPPPDKDPFEKKAEEYCGVDISETANLWKSKNKMFLVKSKLKKIKFIYPYNDQQNSSITSHLTQSTNIVINAKLSKSIKLLGSNKKPQLIRKGMENSYKILPNVPEYTQDGIGLLPPIKVESMNIQPNYSPYSYMNYSTEMIAELVLSEDYNTFLKVMYDNKYAINSTTVEQLKNAKLGNFAEKINAMITEGKSTQLSLFEIAVTISMFNPSYPELQKCSGKITLFPPLNDDQTINTEYATAYTEKDFISSTGRHYIKCNLNMYGMGMMMPPHYWHMMTMDSDMFLHDRYMFERFFRNFENLTIKDMSAQDTIATKEVEEIAKKETDADKRISDATNIPPENPNEPTLPSEPSVPADETSAFDPKQNDPVCKSLSSLYANTDSNLYLNRAGLIMNNIITINPSTGMYPVNTSIYDSCKTSYVNSAQLHSTGMFSNIWNFNNNISGNYQTNPMSVSGDGNKILSSNLNNDFNMTVDNSNRCQNYPQSKLLNLNSLNNIIYTKFSLTTLSKNKNMWAKGSTSIKTTLSNSITFNNRLLNTLNTVSGDPSTTYKVYTSTDKFEKTSPFSINKLGILSNTFSNTIYNNIFLETESQDVTIEDLEPETTYHVAVVAENSDGTVLTYDPIEVTTAAAEAVEEEPVVEEEPQIPALTAGTFTVAEGVTTVSVTITAATGGTGTKTYKTYYKAGTFSASTTTVIETEGTLASTVTDISSAISITGLTAGTAYHFAVIVIDGASTKAAYTIVSETTREHFILYTITAPSGNMGGIEGADALCAASLPAGVLTAKAFLADGTTRRACSTANCGGGVSEHIEWVLAANTTYVNTSNQAVVTTNELGLFSFPLTTAVGAGETWTGLNRNWTSTSDCNDWTSSAVATTGIVGEAGSVNNDGGWDSLLYKYSQTCDRTNVKLLCVEQ